jgi:hypothetical protein
MLKHWERLTLFLRRAGAPLDNNVCERALKKAILHGKNALFYKTQNGALVGDLLLSLIYTCQLNDANPFDYLTVLQQHAEQLVASPSDGCPGIVAQRWRRARARRIIANGSRRRRSKQATESRLCPSASRTNARRPASKQRPRPLVQGDAREGPEGCASPASSPLNHCAALSGSSVTPARPRQSPAPHEIHRCRTANRAIRSSS